jgi:nicotinate-nucleotide pyrophosphorylase (carboxylating)
VINYFQYKKLPNKYILDKINSFLEEDIPDIDITTKHTVQKNATITAKILAAEDMIFSGEEIIDKCFGSTCKTKINCKNGQKVVADDIIGVIKGPSRTILSNERVMLNLIQRLCGITTISNEYAQLAKPYNIKILDTRKTTPGLRLFEKYAVSIGGAYNHRLNLSDGILIKDNHIISAGSITNAILAIKKINTQFSIELEVDNLNQIEEALKIGVDGFLLDNMNPNKIKKAVSLIRNEINGKNIFIEASGGITLNNILPYLQTGINAISIGALTHHAVSKDIKLNFVS